MLNQEYPKFEKGSFEGIEISLSEPNVKINLRGKKKEFFTKIGKILSIIFSFVVRCLDPWLAITTRREARIMTASL